MPQNVPLIINHNLLTPNHYATHTFIKTSIAHIYTHIFTHTFVYFIFYTNIEISMTSQSKFYSHNLIHIVQGPQIMETNE